MGIVYHKNIAIVDTDSHLSKWIVEHDTLEVAKSYCLLFRKYIHDGSFVIDVGACLGDMTATFSYMVGESGEVWAFEPMPESAACLRHNMEAYKNVSCFGIGLGAIKGTAQVHHADRTRLNLGATQLRDNGPLQVMPLDYFTLQRDKKVDFIKIDVEGWEPRVIAGAIKTLERDHPVLLIEVNRPVLEEQGFKDEDIFTPLYKLGYRIIPSEPHIPMDSEMLDVLCLP